MLAYERSAWNAGVKRLAGVDEAGRGPLAGPVVAAAVRIDQSWLDSPSAPNELSAIADSKKCTARRRERLYAFLTEWPHVHYAVATIPPETIDAINILQATHRAMAEALAGLRPAAEHALIDGRPVPGLPCPSTAIVGGDGQSLLIAAASILAKVTRDRIMLEWDAIYPHYGFAAHKGYGTQAHLAALRQHGPCPLHRRSFAPVAQCLSETEP